MGVKTELEMSGLVKMVVGVVVLVAGVIEIGCKIIEELVVFVWYKVSKLKVSGVVVIIRRVNGIYIESEIE